MLKLIYSLIFLLPILNKAQMPDWENFNSRNSGLPSDIVFQIRQDSLNNMWFATINGLVRFDGQNWEVFNDQNTILPSRIVDDFQFDNNGHIWLLNSSYLVDFNYAQENMKLIKIDSTDYCEVLHIDNNNNKWLGHYTKLIKYDGQKFSAYLYGEYISSILSVGDSLFVGSRHYMSEGKLFLSDQPDSMGNPIFNNITQQMSISNEPISVRDIYRDKFARIWVATSEGVAFLENNTWTVYNYNDFLTDPNDSDNDYSTGVAFDKNNNLWVALLFNGLAIFDGSNWIRIPAESFESNFNLSQLKIWKIFSDYDGRIWIGTNDGVFVYSGEITKVKKRDNINFNLDISCYPNPFNNSTNINYSVKNNGKIKIVAYNILGERIQILVDGYKEIGEYFIEFGNINIPSGIYFITLYYENNFIKTIKVLLNK